MLTNVVSGSLPTLAAMSAVVGFATYSMTLSVTASLISSAATAALWVAGVALNATWQVRDEAALYGRPGARAVRGGWPSRILAALPALLGVLFLFGSDPVNDGERVAGAVVGVLCLGFAYYIFTGRFAAGFRRIRWVLHTSQSGRWIVGLALGAGLSLLFGLGGFSTVQGLRDNGVTTTARVQEVTHFKGASTYFLRYALENGSEATCSTGDVLGEPQRGDTIQIMYDRQDPGINCQSASYGTDLTEAVVFTAAGGAMLLAAVTAYFFARRRVERR